MTVVRYLPSNLTQKPLRKIRLILNAHKSEIMEYMLILMYLERAENNSEDPHNELYGVYVVVVQNVTQQNVVCISSRRMKLVI